MSYIKKFIDRVSLGEAKQSRDIVLPISEARFLRDELSKLLVDNNDLLQNKTSTEPVFQVEINGGKF
jgi:hypothetical protein